MSRIGGRRWGRGAGRGPGMGSVPRMQVMAKTNSNSERARYCIGCSYLLNHLADDVCPECGRAFDRADGRTFSAFPTRAPQLVASWTWRLTLALLVPGNLLAMWWSGVGGDPLAVIVLPIMAGLPILYLVGIWFGAHVEGHRRVPVSKSILVAVLISNIASIPITNWPLRITWLASRSALENLADRVAAGENPTVPCRAGLFTIRKVDVRGGDEVVMLWMDPGGAGPSGWARGPLEEAARSVNLSIQTVVAPEWSLLHLD